mgnify:CR=1 FL=1|jgi:putative Holliday junction resolvase
MRFLGIDYGNKRIGISISDQSNVIANPYSTIINKGHKEVVKEIKEIIAQKEISHIVIGMPFSFDFDETEQTKTTQGFIDYLNKEMPQISVVIENEILSTKEAENKLDNHKNKKSVIDETASCLILQSFLDKRHDQQ